MTAGARLLLLGIWVGCLMGFVGMLPAIFSSLPGTELPARIVGKAVDQFDLLGIVFGALCVALALPLLRGGPRSLTRRTRALLPLVAVSLHALSLLWVSPAIRGVRAAAGGSIQSLSAGDPLLLEFSRLHQLSTGLYLSAALIALLTAVWDVLSQRKIADRGF